MKKISVLSLALLFLMLLASCGVDSNNSDTNTESQELLNEVSVDDGSDEAKQTEFERLITELQESDPSIFDCTDILPRLYEVIPYTFVPDVSDFSEKEVCISSLASLKPNDTSYEMYDNLFNWEYPSTFQEEREEMFLLLSEIDGIVLQTNGFSVIDNDAFTLVEEYKYGTFQLTSPYGDSHYRSFIYYGELSNNRPNGAGVLLQIEGNGIIPRFAGHFEAGLIKGYGIMFTDQFQSAPFDGIRSEGYFDYSTEDTSIGNYGDLNGTGIVYHETSDHNTALFALIYENNDDNDYGAMNSDGIINCTVITNYPVSRPKVHYEGKYENGSFVEGKEYYEEDTCYGQLKCSGNFDNVISKGVFYCSDGTCLNGVFLDFYPAFIGGIYYPSGNIQFAGILSSFDVNNNLPSVFNPGLYYAGVVYEEDGTVQGTVEDGKFRWS